VPSLVIILISILCVNAAEMAHIRAAASETGHTRTMFDYVLGCCSLLLNKDTLDV